MNVRTPRLPSRGLRATGKNTGKVLLAATLDVLRRDRVVLGFFVVLLVVDAAFISIHVYRGFLREFGLDAGWLADPRFSLLQDRGYAESFNFLKLGFVASVLVAIWKARRQVIYIAFAGVYLLALADDSLGLHEAGGHLLRQWVGADTLLGDRVDDVGELVTWGLLAAVAIPGLVHAGRESRVADTRIGFGFVTCLILLAGFAVGVDMLHAIEPTHLLFRLIGTVEDGGELLVGSLTTTFTLLVLRHHRQLADRVAVG